MTQITHGQVVVEDGVNPTPEVFGTSRKVRVEINFAISEHTEDPAVPSALLERAGTLADRQVAKLLGRVYATELPAGSTLETQLAASVEATKPRRTRAPRVEEPASPPAETPADEGYAPATSADATSPEVPAAEEKAESADAGGDEWGAPAVEEIADKALTDAASKHSARLADAGDAGAVVRIRKLIGEYNPDPTKQFSLTQLPQNQRADFLKKIEALKPGDA